MDATKRVNDLIVVTERLIAVLDQENEILTERRYSELNVILDQKATIGRVYESRVMGFSENVECLEEVDEDLRDRLKELAHKVDERMAENTQMLKIAIIASRRVVDLIAEAVRTSAPTAGTYSSKGGQSGIAAKPEDMSLSLNETL